MNLKRQVTKEKLPFKERKGARASGITKKFAIQVKSTEKQKVKK
jgi:hypothetical protein